MPVARHVTIMRDNGSWAGTAHLPRRRLRLAGGSAVLQFDDDDPPPIPVGGADQGWEGPANTTLRLIPTGFIGRRRDASEGDALAPGRQSYGVLCQYVRQAVTGMAIASTSAGRTSTRAGTPRVAPVM